MDRLCSWYERVEGYGMEYVWFHKPIYKGCAYEIATLYIFSGDVIFYDTWDDYFNNVHKCTAKIYPKITRDPYTGIWRINYAPGYSRECQKGEFEAYRIQRMFRKTISDPKYKMCRDRLKREFQELS